MRTSLLPGLLDMLRKNTLKQNLDARLFEMAKIFVPEAGADLPREEEWLAGVLYGGWTQPSWHWEPLKEWTFTTSRGWWKNCWRGCGSGT